MKKSKNCPKCESHTIGVFQLGLSAVNKDDTIDIGGSFYANAYTCADCGYLEWFLSPPLNEWENPPDESKMVFGWLRRPPHHEGPFR